MNHAKQGFFGRGEAGVAQGTGWVLVNIMTFYFDDDMISVGLISRVNGEFKLHTVKALHPKLS